MKSLFYAILDKYERRDWMHSGLRTWHPQTYHRFFISYDGPEDYQGDKRYSLTVHFFGRAWQYTYWRAER